MQETTKGQYGGIGIHIGIKNGLLTVIAPIEDTPAFKAGVQGGDRIVEINGEKTAKMKLEEAVDRLKGTKGTKVRITVLRTGEDDPREFEIERDEIELPSVKGAKIIKNGIGYVRITQFSANTDELLQEALGKLQKEGLNALVLDMRNNPGGLLLTAIRVAEKFLNEKAPIVMTKGRKGASKDMPPTKAGGLHHYADWPMAVLVNGHSASAAEIVAGALQDNKRAVLIGDLTYGKASVQSIIPLRTETNAAVRITTARYYTPSGRQIHDNGIEPDIQVYVPPSEWNTVMAARMQIENPKLYTDEDRKKYEGVTDRQLARAVDLLDALKVYRNR
jgi:carboxyl-terminal processing protease